MLRLQGYVKVLSISLHHIVSLVNKALSISKLKIQLDILKLDEHELDFFRIVLCPKSQNAMMLLISMKHTSDSFISRVTYIFPGYLLKNF